MIQDDYKTSYLKGRAKLIKALIFDVQGVLYTYEGLNKNLIDQMNELSQTYKLALATNLSRDGISEYIDDSKIKLFSYIHAFGDEGLVKSAHEMYVHIASKLEVEPSECIFIDDNHLYTDAAKLSGMKVILYLNNEDFEQKLNDLTTADE